MIDKIGFIKKHEIVNDQDNIFMTTYKNKGNEVVFSINKVKDFYKFYIYHDMIDFITKKIKEKSKTISFSKLEEGKKEIAKNTRLNNCNISHCGNILYTIGQLEYDGGIGYTFEKGVYKLYFNENFQDYYMNILED